MAVILLEIGAMSRRVGSPDVSNAVRGLFFRDLNMSDVSNVESSSPGLLQQQPLSPISVQEPDENVNRPNVPPPLSLKKIFPLARNSPDADFHYKHRWSQPFVMQAYIRYKADVNDAMDVVLFTTGITMGTFERNFTAAGCMIGNHVYPVDHFIFDKAICTVPKGIEKGKLMTVVIFKDEVVKAALKGPVTIAKEFVAELEDGDLRPLKDETVLHGALKELDFEELLAVKSRTVYSEQLDPYSPDEFKTLPRYEMCLATQIKPSTDLLPDWLDYHRRIGVDFVYVFDNHAEEDVSALLADRHDVEVLYWPWEKSQIQAFTYAAYSMRARCEWMITMDTDEYLMFGLDGPERLSKRPYPPLKEYIRNKEKAGFAMVQFRWLLMKNSGYVERPEKPVPEAYIHMQIPQVPKNLDKPLAKAMVSMDYNWISSNAHGKRASERAPMFDGFNGEYYPKRISDNALIVHYRTRSWVEYQDKILSGRANINNPKTMSLMKQWMNTAKDENKEAYMQASALRRKEYTHFRDIWRRVTTETRVGKSVTRRFVDGKFCRTLYDLSRNKLMEPTKEVCRKVR